MHDSLPTESLADFTPARAHQDVALIGRVLDDDECRTLVDAFQRNRHQARVYVEPYLKHFDRRTMFVDRIEPEVADIAYRLSARIVPLMRQIFNVTRSIADDMPQIVAWPAPHGMGWHHDVDPPHRQFTAVTYIGVSPDLIGGETAFRDQRMLVAPVVGSASLFRSQVFHGVRDVVQGERYALTCWYRYID